MSEARSPKLPARREILRDLRQLGFRPKTRLGQNFLFDPQLLEAFLDDAEVQPGERILEVGAGCGSLTQRLLARGCDVVAAEVDPILVTFLNQHLASPSLTVVAGDALHRKSRLSPSLMAAVSRWNRPYRLIASLPYAIATPLIHLLLEADAPLGGFGVLVQRELAERWTARPGDRQYGPTAVILSLLGRARMTRRVAPHLFSPPPKVESAFCVWSWAEVGVEFPTEVSVLCRKLFQHRRKMLRALLRRELPPDDPFWAAGDLRPQQRPEEVSPEGFQRLAEELGRRDREGSP